MKVPTVKFNMQDQPDFVKVLRKKVDNYFKENNLSRYANSSMKFKTTFMLGLYIIPFVLMLTGVVSSLWPVLFLWLLMSMGMAGIGMAVMHDANHGSYSKNKYVNYTLGFLPNFLGVYHINWKIQHNVLHHSFTNVEHYDEDINAPVMRFTPNQDRSKFFRFQMYYAPLVYGLMTLYWVFSRDFSSLLKFHKKKLLAGQGLTLKKGMTQIILYKFWYLALTLGLPLILVALPWWQTIIGFLIMQFAAGMLLALVFQPAHVIEETKFYVAKEGSVDNNWAIHQLRTTANFANSSKWFTWFVGGLNFQIEHHLFPNICHVHYRKISKFVKETAEEFNIPYHHHRTFFGALKSHFTLLNQLGTGKYDINLARS